MIFGMMGANQVPVKSGKKQAYFDRLGSCIVEGWKPGPPDSCIGRPRRGGWVDKDASLCEYVFMRTTLDIPEELFKAAKIQAAHEGVSLKAVFTRALEREFAAPGADAASRGKRAKRLIEALSKGRNSRPIGRLRREELHDRPILRGH